MRIDRTFIFHTNKSAGFNAGVAIKVSNGVAAGVTLGGNYGKGYGNGDEKTYVASHVGDANSQMTVIAGGDANLIGSQLKGQKIQLDAQNLNIESLQDTATYKGKQMNMAGSVTVGYGVAVGGSYSQSKINAEHASVNEQAGIYAGDEGYHINVNNHTDLKGAIITSTQQADLRKQIKEAKTEEEKTALYNEIYKLQYQKRLLETVVGIVAGSPDVAITQGTLQLAATKMREETLKNSRLFKGIKDAKTGQVLRNDSYDSGYFDGVKLGGVRIDVDVICNSGMGSCSQNSDGSINFIGKGDKVLSDTIDPAQNEKAAGLYGETGGFQSVKGEWNLHFKRFPYEVGSISDFTVESFAGTHDFTGGQIWGWYDKQGNTAKKNSFTSVASTVTTVVAIPLSAPFAVADVLSSDFVEVLIQIGGH
ncbi:hypothetical protein BKK48_09175 [Rodentibacter heidelbergensis]|uniref:Uncharacterized protein n=1 Tax=Rodentibacter heidelbergensis TaxID=1908258 RepID=A0A1V3I6J6_9PAST|nr:hemagglutinin repeat-containing protein [Rodentibacter heidelbergensis]OOF35621.1 hypothetical protein BKK48_09175 [Rodentibacter heidelbergensis]